MSSQFTIGLLKMHKEASERRAFLPSFVARMAQHGAQVVLETGYGSGMTYREDDYRRAAVSARFAPPEEVYRQDYVLVVRYPNDAEIALMRPGSCLMTMAHYATRPERMADLGCRSSRGARDRGHSAGQPGQIRLLPR